MFSGLVSPRSKYAIGRRFGDVMPLQLFLALLRTTDSSTIGKGGTVYRQRAQAMPHFFIYAVRELEPWTPPRAQTKSHGLGSTQIEGRACWPDPA
jgi:hypothetical protein